jgi:hypothetical protein
MPDLERRIKDTLDRLGEPTDPARVLGQVGRRKRHLRLVRRVQAVALVVAVLAGVGAGTYALSRAFGFGAPQPVSSPSSPPSPVIAPCAHQIATVGVDSTGGGAGTISTVWRVTNSGSAACRSKGYPGMDFHAATGWLNAQVHRGGFPNIDQPPTSIVVPPQGSLYFVSYWNDATTEAGPCRQFDRVRVTLPDDQVPVEIASSGCLGPLSVDVGPVVRTPPT